MTTEASGNRDVYSISRLNAEARAVLDSSFPLLWVEGEISNLVAARSGHLYFSLKDAQAQVRCALFRGKRQLLRFAPANGDRVLARVRISFYEPRGEFQLMIEHLEPAGAGDAQRAFEELKRRLDAEGLFDSALKRPLPAFPRRIGVITSPTGAAIRDVLQVLRRRAPQIAVTLYPALVQGRDAAADLLAALQAAIARNDCDVLLLTRGGGAVEDLAAFNDESLARVIAASPIPIVSAVGHEIDFTIADFVADRRAPTPSAAAELLSPDSDALSSNLARQRQRLLAAVRRQHATQRQQLTVLDTRLRRAAPANRLRQQQQRLDRLDLQLRRLLNSHIDRDRRRLAAATRQFNLLSPQNRLQQFGQHLQRLQQRLHKAAKAGIEQPRARLEAGMRQLNAVSPLATLQRGYSVLRDPDTGEVISRAGQVKAGDPLRILLADGELDAIVENVVADEGAGK